MSNNQDNDDIDFDDEVGFNDDAGLDDYKESGTLGDLWRNNPMVKTGVILAGVAVLAFAVFLFSGRREREPDTRMVSAPNSRDTGAENNVVTENYREAIDELNEQKVEEALQTGTSALPVNVDTNLGRIAPEVVEDPEEDPLERWRRLQEQRLRQQPERQVDERIREPNAPEVDTRALAVEAMSTAMATQMETILGARTIPQLQIQRITPVEYIEDLQRKRDEEREAAMAAASEGGEQGVDVILLPAGTIEYGQMITEANSDAPGPVLVQLASGPLKGARLLGGFEVRRNYLVLNFNQIVIDGISHDADAVAIDPATANPGVATEVDQRYLTRFVLPAAAAFIEGMGEAVAQSESTTVSINNNSTSSTEEDLDTRQEVAKGIEELGSQVGDALDQIASETKPLIRVAAGTPLGILFVQPVLENK